MADADASTTQTGSSTIIYIWKIPIDKTYVLSITSILKLAAAFLSLIAFICVASGRSDNCDDSYASTYNYFQFVSMSAFLTFLLGWLLYALTLTTRLFMKVVPWNFGDLIICAVFSLLYLIANIVLAAQSCGKDSNKAGAAFGFFAMFCICGNAFLSFKDWRSERQSSSDTGKSQDYNAERNMEQY